MAEAPRYSPQIRPAAPQAAGVQTQAIPDLSGAAIGAAAAQFGQAIDGYQLQLERSQQETRKAQALTEYLTELDKLEADHSRDPDFQNAPKKFQAASDELRQRLLANAQLGQAQQAELDLRMTSLQKTSHGKVRSASLTRESDANVANLTTRLFTYQSRFARAGSDVERTAIEAEAFADIDRQVQGLWVSQRGAEALKQNWLKEKDQLTLARGIRQDPLRFRALLDDPNFLPNLDPLARENAINQAQAAADQRGIDDLTMRARFNPHQASLILNRVISPDHATAIFDQGLIPVESNNDPKAVSNKGALGLAQVMPATAREVLKSLGMNDLAALSDDDLKKKMLEDPALNRRVGLTYWQQMIARYDGNIALAMAAYNAGPTRADLWKKKAEEQFGASFTPAQLASVIPIKETRDYIGKIYARLDVPADGLRMSPHAVVRAATVVGAELNAQRTAETQALKALADVTRSENNIVEIYKAGFNVDPEVEAAIMNPNRAAAARGDPAAIKFVREAEFYKANAPYVNAAYALPPAQLAAEVNQMEAALAKSSNVTEEQKRRFDAFKAVLGIVRERANDDPLSLAARARIFQPVAIDPNFKPEDPGSLQALAVRAQQARLAADRYGGALKIFKPAEAEAIKARVAEMGVSERVNFVDGITRAMPEAAARAALAQAGFDAKTIAAAELTRGRKDMLGEILQGHALLKEEGTKPNALTLRAAFANTLGGRLWHQAGAQDAVTDAAVALYVARRGVTGALYEAPDQAALEAAIADVAGTIVKHNGIKVAVPVGMRQGEFFATMASLDERAVALMGGAFDRSGQPFSADWIRKKAILKQTAPGADTYFVGFHDDREPDKFAPVFTAGETPAPLVFDLRGLASWTAQTGRRDITPRERGVLDFNTMQRELILRSRGQE